MAIGGEMWASSNLLTTTRPGVGTTTLSSLSSLHKHKCLPAALSSSLLRGPNEFACIILSLVDDARRGMKTKKRTERKCSFVEWNVKERPNHFSPRDERIIFVCSRSTKRLMLPTFPARRSLIIWNVRVQRMNIPGRTVNPISLIARVFSASAKVLKMDDLIWLLRER